MPLYIDPETLKKYYPEDIVQAFFDIKADVGKTAITPRIALNLIEKYFLPFDPEWVGGALKIRSEVNWDTVYFIGVYLVQQGYARDGKDNPLAYAIHDFYGFCKKTKDPERLEPDHVLATCKLCWRHPVAYKNYCYFHNPKINNTNYKHALRWRDEFGRVHNELVIGEVHESEKTGSTYKYFFPQENQKDWLRNVRPKVWAAVSPRIGNCADKDFLELLLLELDWIEEEGPAQKQQRKRIHAEMIAEPHLISTMLGLAEAWIMIEECRSSILGGKRKNSGRKKRSSNL